MNPAYFTDASVSMSQPLQGLTQVPNTSIPKGSLHELKVNDTEMQLLLGHIFNHLQIQPPEGLRQQAEFLQQQFTHDQIYALAQQKYMERSHAYMNGSVLERVKRFFGGHPMPPMHPTQMQMMQQQAMMYQQPMYGQPMPQQQPIGYAQPQMMTPPQPQPDMMQMQEQVNNLTMAVQQMMQEMNKGKDQ